MASLAEFERDLVRERVRSGVAAAKARGQKLGRQPGQRVKADKLTPKVLQMVQSGYSYRKIAASLHLSKTTVNDIVKRHRLSSNATISNQANLSPALEQPTMKTRKSASNQTVYQLKITLKDIRPPIWRRNTGIKFNDASTVTSDCASGNGLGELSYAFLFDCWY